MTSQHGSVSYRIYALETARRFEVLIFDCEMELAAQNASTSRNPVHLLASLQLRLSAFFGWQLLGYVPGGAPFSQLNIGVTDAMAIIKS